MTFLPSPVVRHCLPLSTHDLSVLIRLVSYCHCPPSIFLCFHKQMPAGIQAYHSLTHCPIILWRLSPALYKRVPGSELSFSHFSPNRLNYQNCGNTTLFNITTVFFIIGTTDSHRLSHGASEPEGQMSYGFTQGNFFSLYRFSVSPSHSPAPRPWLRPMGPGFSLQGLASAPGPWLPPPGPGCSPWALAPDTRP